MCKYMYVYIFAWMNVYILRINATICCKLSMSGAACNILNEMHFCWNAKKTKANNILNKPSGAAMTAIALKYCQLALYATNSGNNHDTTSKVQQNDVSMNCKCECACVGCNKAGIYVCMWHVAWIDVYGMLHATLYLWYWQNAWQPTDNSK